MPDSPHVEVEILADGDVLRAERQARSLRDALSDVEGIEVRAPEPSTSAADGAKGAGALGDASLWVFLTVSARGGTAVLIAAIRAWTEREKRRVVRLRVGDRKIELPGEVTEAQERALEAFLRHEEH